MVYIISSITPKDAQEISTWTYDPPYDLYSMSSEDIPGFLRVEYRYHVLLDEDIDLVGYCCFGEDARVPGGDYTRGEPEVLDLGIGMRPDLTGKGFGKDFVQEILAFAYQAYHPSTFRVTIAAFNLRSLRTFHGLGFKETHQFTRDLVKIKFVQLERPVGNSISNNTL
jgi:RimJ/RimL family protein N-acetyltransferase